MYAISTKPDLGTALLAESMSSGEGVTIRGVHLSSMMRFTSKQYAAVTGVSYEGEVYSTTFLFDLASFKAFLQLLPKGDRLDVQDKIGGARGDLQRADFPDLKVNVRTRLGEPTWGILEQIVPLVVTHIEPAGARSEPGTFESWDEGNPLPDFGTHMSRARPNQAVFQFPIKGLTHLVYIGDDTFLALGYESEGNKTYSVTFQLDLATLERLIENSMIRESPEVRSALLGPLEQFESFEIIGVVVNLETRIGVRRNLKGEHVVPFIVTNVTEAVEEPEEEEEGELLQPSYIEHT